jgi:hypothetical protein
MEKGRRRTHHMFTIEEDFRLMDLILCFGDNQWGSIEREMVTKNKRQCRERYLNYLHPQVNNEPWSTEEDHHLINMISTIGPSWEKLSKHFHCRTAINIRNRWNIVKKKYIYQIQGQVPPSEPIQDFTESRFALLNLLQNQPAPTEADNFPIVTKFTEFNL